MAEKTDARGLFDALGPAWDAVQEKTVLRDDVAASGAKAIEKAQNALDAVRAKEDAKLTEANQALSDATSALNVIQDKLAAVIGRSGDPTRIR